MDVQIGKLSEGVKQAAHADETLSRIEQVSSEIATQIEHAQKTKEVFAGDLAKLAKDRGELTEFVKGHFERLALERKEFESFDQRVQSLQNSLGVLERGFDGLAAKDKTIGDVSQKADALTKQLTGLASRAEALAGRQDGLDALEQRVEPGRRARQAGRASARHAGPGPHGARRVA